MPALDLGSTGSSMCMELQARPAARILPGDFDGDNDAVGELLETAERNPAQLGHTAERLRQTVVQRREQIAYAASLEALGIRIASSSPLVPLVIPGLGHAQDQVPVLTWMTVKKPPRRLGMRYRAARHAVVCAHLLSQSSQGHHARLAEGFPQLG